jgi:pimeloyl-ACP methyl ester carboxylesterase
MRTLLSILLFIPLVLFAQSELPIDENKLIIKKSAYTKWLSETTQNLKNAGRVVHTPFGDIQIVVKDGRGPVIVVLHGGFGGWDQGVLVASDLAKRGFKVIIPSRPGYLSSPLYTNPIILEETTPRQQATLLAALLNQLQIPEVVVMGFSAGAPVAYEFGLRYPHRTQAVVLQSIGANPSEDGFFYAALGDLLVTNTASIDFVTYLVHLSLVVDYYSTALKVMPMDTMLKGDNLKRRMIYIINHPEQYNFLRYMLVATIPISPRLAGTLNDFLGVDYWTKTFTPPVNYPPTLIIQAINDSNGYYPTAKSVQANIPNSHLISVKMSGHFIWLGPFTDNWKKHLLDFITLHTSVQ